MELLWCKALAPPAQAEGSAGSGPTRPGLSTAAVRLRAASPASDGLAGIANGASLGIIQVNRILQDLTRWHPLRLAPATLALGVGLALGARAASPLQVSGIYPHLAFFNEGAECGTGAVVPWADRLWAVTYSPHEPRGSSD